MDIPTAQSVLGRLIRLPLKAIPANRPRRVLYGPLRGVRWIPGASVHGCWLGSFERYEQNLFAQLVRPGQVVFDLGANVGFYTLLAAHLVGPAGRVVAFEPVARNLGYLRRHLDLNAYTNVSVLEVAVADQSGTSDFQPGVAHAEGRIVADGQAMPSHYRVPVVTLDQLVDSGKVPVPHMLKIDVEGAEAAVLHGASHLLLHSRPTILLSTHSTALRDKCSSLLSSLAYDVRPMVASGRLSTELYCVPQAYPARRAD